jgi:hypothetical protein
MTVGRRLLGTGSLRRSPSAAEAAAFDKETAMKFWMAGPTSEPAISEGTAVGTRMLVGRWLQGGFKGQRMGTPS